MKTILNLILDKVLGNKAWTGIAVLVTIVSIFFSQSTPTINQKISLIKLSQDVSNKYEIEDSKYIRKDDEINIVKNEFKNNTFIFAIRNNTNHEILINKAKLNLYTTYDNCYQPTPVKYKVDFVLQKSRYEINGTIVSVNELEFEWNEIIESQKIEIYHLSINDLYLDKDSCVNGLLVNLDLIYDNKYRVSTPVLRIKNNESH